MYLCAIHFSILPAPMEKGKVKQCRVWLVLGWVTFFLQVLFKDSRVLLVLEFIIFRLYSSDFLQITKIANNKYCICTEVLTLLYCKAYTCCI